MFLALLRDPAVTARRKHGEDPQFVGEILLDLQVFDMAETGMVLTDSSGHFRGVNRTFARMLGRSIESSGDYGACPGRKNGKGNTAAMPMRTANRAGGKLFTAW